MIVGDFLSLGVGGPSIPDYPIAIAIDSILPSQVNAAGRALVSNGQHAYWGVPTGPGVGMTIGDPVNGGTSTCVLFVATTSTTLNQSTNFQWDNNNKRLGLGLLGASPAQRLHVDGSVRIDNTNALTGHAINLYFGKTLDSTDSALIQYASAAVVVSSAGVLLTGLGSTNATTGVTGDTFLINTGCHLAFASSNIQATTAELTAVYACAGVPSNLVGADGNFMLRSDGTVSTALYYKISGAWSAVGAGGGGGGMAIGGAVSGGTGGSVLFVDGGGNLAQDNTQFKWDDTAKTLRIGFGTFSCDVNSNIYIRDSALSGTITTGNACVSIGSGNPLDALTTGHDDIAIGQGAGIGITTASDVVCLGHGAGSNVVTGSNNTFCGTAADASGAAATNQNSFGYQAACIADNQVTLGNASITVLRCKVTTITAISDARDKVNIRELRYGLDFLLKLIPSEFDWSMRDGSVVGLKDIGFIAQDVQPIDDDRLRLVYDADPDRLELTPGRILPILVKGFHEVSARLNALEAQLQPT